MDDFFKPASNRSDGHSARIKALIRQEFSLDEDIPLMVSELRCHEEGCPDVETVIAVMRVREEPLSWKVAKPMSDVLPSDIESLQQSG